MVYTIGKARSLLLNNQNSASVDSERKDHGDVVATTFAFAAWERNEVARAASHGLA
jgi:hypothetical protein